MSLLDTPATGGLIDTQVVVAVRNDLLRYGIERMLQSRAVAGVRTIPGLRHVSEVSGSGGQTLVVAVDEIDETAAADLRDLERTGVRILLLLGDGGLEDLSRIGMAHGVHGSGFLTVSGLNEATLFETLARTASGEVPMPPDLARRLLTLAARRPDPPRSGPRITPREQEALALMVEGMSNKQIARGLRISEHGAKRLVANIMAKLDCTNRTGAVVKALRQGLYDQPA